MLILIWLVVSLVAVFMSLLPLTLRRREVYKQFSGSRLVTCPENQQPAAVGMDARHAVVSSMDGTPEVRLCDCTRWPERANCAGACLSQAVQAGPGAAGEVKVHTKQIYHLPIILAALTAWCLGVFWHSEYLFRARWMAAVGLTRTQVKQMVWWLWPHLFTAAVCLLFAYGVAWLLAVSHRKGVLQGVLMSILLGAALTASAGYGIARLPHDLLRIEAGYALLAVLATGGIVGGLYNKLVLAPE